MKEFNGRPRQIYVKRITRDVSKLISQKMGIPIDKARKEFVKTPVYNYLAYADDRFVEDSPYDFYELYVNFKKTGKLISSTELYLEKHPELYEIV